MTGGGGFPGSYHPHDVMFLLQQLAMTPTPVEEKERLLQSGQRHYSEMIGTEAPPDADYLALYRIALANNGDRLARDVARLAHAIAAARPGPVTLLSLARAGTPIGVLLRRALARLGRSVVHYSISIIRGRGIDTLALDYVAARHDPGTWIFVDGWTGKGAITRELRASFAAYGEARGLAQEATLAVVSDLAGLADIAATDDDYLIPSSILNAVVSGLVSRTILPPGHTAQHGFHGCIVYDELSPHDLSREFVDALSPLVEAALAVVDPQIVHLPASTRARSAAFLTDAMRRWRIVDENRVKPGIGESTRALLRRAPERLVVREAGADDVRHLLVLADRRAVPVEVDPDLPYRAVVLIRSMGVER